MCFGINKGTTYLASIPSLKYTIDKTTIICDNTGHPQDNLLFSYLEFF